AISSLAHLQKDNKDITKQIASYLSEPHFPIRFASIFALGARGDASAIPALEVLLKSDDLSIEMAPMIKRQIASLKKPSGGKGAAIGEEGEEGEGAEGASAAAAGNDQSAVAKRLDRLEHLVQEVNDRLKTIETHLPPPKHGGGLPIVDISQRSQKLGAHKYSQRSSITIHGVQLRVSDFDPHGCANKMRKSRKLFPVGPVTIVSPSLAK